jgi:hypothetical protein
MKRFFYLSMIVAIFCMGGLFGAENEQGVSQGSLMKSVNASLPEQVSVASVEQPVTEVEVTVTDKSQPDKASEVKTVAIESDVASSDKKVVVGGEASKEDENEIPLAPVEQTPQEIKQEAMEKEKVELDLTPPECLPSDLDTTGPDAGGNWVLKRAFWEQGEKTYEKIMQANNGLYDLHVKFVQARNAIDKESDTAFRDLGFEQGQVSELLESLIEDTQADREKDGFNEKEREYLKTLKDKQARLEQLKLNLATVGELEEALGKVMSNLDQQVGACRKYERQAWEHFKAIGKELNDKKARLLFYEMEGFLKTVEKNHDYVKNDLWNYFNESSQQVKDHLGKIKSAVDQLKQAGTDLEKEFEKFNKVDEEKDEKDLETEKENIQQEMAEIARQKKELQQKKGFFNQVSLWSNKIWQSVKDTSVKVYDGSFIGINYVWSFAKEMAEKVLHLFDKKKSEKVVDEKKPEAQVVDKKVSVEKKKVSQGKPA